MPRESIAVTLTEDKQLRLTQWIRAVHMANDLAMVLQIGRLFDVIAKFEGQLSILRRICAAVSVRKHNGAWLAIAHDQELDHRQS